MSEALVSSGTILAAARNHVCSSLPFACYSSLPIPILHAGKPAIVVFIGHGEFENPESGYQIRVPHLAAIFDSRSGLLQELRSVAADDDKARPQTGHGIPPTDKLTPEFLCKQAAYTQQVDMVTAATVSGTMTRELLNTLEQRFIDCSEPALLGLFHHVVLKEF